MEKNSIKAKKKNLKSKKIRNILKEKKLKGKKFVASVLDVALLYAIHGATIENTLFEDGDSANIFRVYPTQEFLHFFLNYY